MRVEQIIRPIIYSPSAIIFDQIFLPIPASIELRVIILCWTSRYNSDSIFTKIDRQRRPIFLSLLHWFGGIRTKFENIARLAIERTTNGIKRRKAYCTHLARFEFRKIYNRNINAFREFLQRHLSSCESRVKQKKQPIWTASSFERKTRVCPSAPHSVYQAIAFAQYYTPNSRDTWEVSGCRYRDRLFPYKLQNYSCLRQIYE